MSRYTFTPFPLITTERLVLRPLERSDDRAMFFLRTAPEVTRFLRHGHPATVSKL